MTPRIQYISVDINGNRSINNLRIKQYDKDIRYIYATITENGVPMDLTEYTGIVSVHKPDDTAVLNNVTEITGSVVKIQLTEQMGAADGVALFEIQLRTLDGGVITTVTFNVKVDKAVNPSGTITSSYEFNALNEALIEVEEAIEYMDDLKELGILTADMKGVADGVASLDENAKVPVEQLPPEALTWDLLPNGNLTNVVGTNVEVDGGLSVNGGGIFYGQTTPFPTGLGDYTAIYTSPTQGNRILGYDGANYKDLKIGSMFGTNKFPLTLKADGSTIIDTPSTKTTPVDADNLFMDDSADVSKLKKLSWLNLKASLKSYFDTLYTAFIPIAQKGVANGVAETDANNKIAGDVLTLIINDLASSTTRTYSSDKINALISGIVGLEVLIVETLPTTNINTHAIYLVPQISPETEDYYNEYLYVNSAWEHIGSTSVDLTNYLKKTDNYAGSSSSAGSADSAIKLNTARAIDGVSFDGATNISHYGVCSTVASTIAKEVTISDYVLDSGARVSIKFTNGNTVDTPTLNVTSTGAKYIYIGTKQASPYDIEANKVYDMIYDGTNYQIVSVPFESIVLTQVQYESLTEGEKTNGKTYYVSDAPQGYVDASLVSYSNTTSGLSATNAQQAIDELASEKIDTGNIAPLYSSGSTYVYNARVMYDGLLYKCNTAISVAEAWNASKWTLENVGNSLKNVYKDTYDISGDRVFQGDVNSAPLGNIYCGASATNLPTSGLYGWLTTVIQNNSTTVFQTFIDTNGISYSRVKSSSVWLSWKSVSQQAYTCNGSISGYSGNLNSIGLGVVWCLNTATNLPVTDNGLCETIIISANFYVQRFTANSTGILYTRNCSNGSWTSWAQQAVERNWLNNAYGNKNVKMDCGTALVNFTNGIGTITLAQSYAHGMPVINILGASWLENASVSGNVLTVQASDSNRVGLNGQAWLKYQIMGW